MGWKSFCLFSLRRELLTPIPVYKQREILFLEHREQFLAACTESGRFQRSFSLMICPGLVFLDGTLWSSSRSMWSEHSQIRWGALYSVFAISHIWSRASYSPWPTATLSSYYPAPVQYSIFDPFYLLPLWSSWFRRLRIHRSRNRRWWTTMFP